MVAILAPIIARYDPVANDFGAMLASPSTAHWLGTDAFGRDVLSRLVYGSRTALLVGFGASVLPLEWRGVERDDAGNLAKPALGEDGRHLCVEEQGVKPGPSVHARNLTVRAHSCPHRPVAPVDRDPASNPSSFKIDQAPMRAHLRVKRNVGEKVLGMRYVSERLLQ